MSKKNKFRLIGIMSGTSLDGVDLCYAEFWKDSKRQWQYYMPYVESYPYSEDWRIRLNTAEHLSAFEYIKLDRELGKKLGELAKCFIDKHNLKVDYVSSHGHTIFHQTDLGVTSQIGSGPEIAVASGHNVINDFRIGDVALGGQGAPLVPIGDRLLFSEYHYRLNLGGIGNISYEVDNETIAFDTSPANMPLNIYMRTLGKEYDDQGAMARRGFVRKEIFDALNNLPFYQTFEKKSLGKEWVEAQYLPLLDKIEKIEDRLATSIEHTAYQIKRIIDQAEQHSKIRFSKSKLLITGGGAFNDYMIERIRTYCSNVEVVLPNEKIINHKEALLFAFLGNLRIHKEVNCLKSVTGAKIDNIGGVVHYIYPDAKEESTSEDQFDENEERPNFNKIIGCGG
ncbi:anhydro-N-acetylmuramic acid kinase [Flammeovirga yaeyamensis]|uniref:Anhydro-N-acetylmuramic acid kinase n=1 Tax=Flammeovirga yaeyamensis TaxID=367791 RepID=A0AAX1MZR0_9BACT|nr:anhydro-N-acetylmuramic acid kinase [Flammeovirga yaeyamensis]MBB3700257.1 anhydro-N-acetylmuramic acid kinase [Flammeovirga yaeyamensis]NMF37117.1 anhydro-N-acetylmuramic acid kinase [Flammeovirga yaeyamensis]QWG00808.1 anhydro-N-acetylmuramic acid kinase [Flammeovirga yaeyamensis]